MTLLHRTVAAPSTRPHLVGPRASGPADPAGWLPRRTAAVSRVVVAGALVAGLADAGWVLGHQPWVLAAGFLLGLPHGAVDHLLPARHAWVRRTPLSMLLVLVGYLALAALALLGLRVAGGVVLPLLLVVSVLHFGAGDLETSAPRRTGTHRLARRLLAAISRGGPVVAGPLVAWPVQTLAVLTTVGLGHAPGRATALALGLVLLAVSGVGVLLAVRAGRAADALETALLVALFLVLPPLAAFGVYFGAWHGLRHTARLLTDDPRSTDDLRHGRLAPPLRRFLRAAALPSLVALASTAALVCVALGHADLSVGVFQLLLALTVPHVVVVALWDHDAGAWTGGTAPAG